MIKQFPKSLLLTLTVLTSLSTLICCTIPIIFVTLGFGSVLAALSSQFHVWIFLANHKFWLFLSSGLCITIAYLSLKHSERSPCPVDEKLAAECAKIRRWNLVVLRLSMIIWITGFFSAYLADKILTSIL